MNSLFLQCRYVHRIGRTGRAGQPGRAYTFFDESLDAERRLAPEIVRQLDLSHQPVPAWLETIAVEWQEEARIRQLRRSTRDARSYRARGGGEGGGFIGVGRGGGVGGVSGGEKGGEEKTIGRVPRGNVGLRGSFSFEDAKRSDKGDVAGSAVTGADQGVTPTDAALSDAVSGVVIGVNGERACEGGLEDENDRLSEAESSYYGSDHFDDADDDDTWN